MIIKFSPQRSSAVLEPLVVAGDVLTINGEPFDFGQLGEGDTLPVGSVQSDFITGAVTRSAGQIVVMVILPHGAEPSEAQAFPQDVVLASGTVEIP